MKHIIFIILLFSATTNASQYCADSLSIALGIESDSIGYYYINSDNSEDMSMESRVRIGSARTKLIYAYRQDWDKYYEMLMADNYEYGSTCAVSFPQIIDKLIQEKEIVIQESLSKIEKNKSRIIRLDLLKIRYMQASFKSKEDRVSAVLAMKSLSDSIDILKIPSKKYIENELLHTHAPRGFYSGVLGIGAYIAQPLINNKMSVTPGIGFEFILGFNTLIGDLYIVDGISFFHYMKNDEEIAKLKLYKDELIENIDGGIFYMLPLKYGRQWKIVPEIGAGVISFDAFIPREGIGTIGYYSFGIRYEKNKGSENEIALNPLGQYSALSSIGLSVRTGMDLRFDSPLELKIDYRRALKTLY